MIRLSLPARQEKNATGRADGISNYGYAPSILHGVADQPAFALTALPSVRSFNIPSTISTVR